MTPTKKNNGITAQQTIEAIRGSKGVVADVARRLGCTRQYVYRLLDKYASAKEELEAERESTKDFVEQQLFKLIDDKNVTAIIFYLKTKAKDRGYVERQEVTGADGQQVKLVVEYADADGQA